MKVPPSFFKLLPSRGPGGRRTGAEPPALSTPPPSRPRLVRPRLPLRHPALWSRYTLGLAGLLGLALLARLPLIWAAPLDTPVGPQAATAAFVRHLAAHGGDIKAGLPWAGPLPADLTAGLPLYAWVAALFSGWWGPQAWVGRGVSVCGALLATVFLFVVVRRMAGGRAALYAALFLTIAPPGLYYGRAYLPDALGWAAGCGALAAALRWRDTVLAHRPHERTWFAVAAASGGLALLIAPANLALLLPLAYLAWPHRWVRDQEPALEDRRAPGPGRPDPQWPEIHDPGVAVPLASRLQNARRGARDARLMTAAFLALVGAPLLAWWALIRIGGAGVVLDPAFGGGGLGAALHTLGQSDFWSLLAGRLVNGSLTASGFLILLAGLGRPARQPWPWLLHLWALGGVLVVLAGAPRLAADDSALTPWLPALAALVGLGANWLATLPAHIAAALRGLDEAPADLDADVADGAPADEPDPTPRPDARRPVRGAVRRTAWGATAPAGRGRPWAATRATLLILGNALTIVLILAVLLGGTNSLLRRYEVSPSSSTYARIGGQAAHTGSAGDGRMVVVGPGAPEMFYATGLTGWALPEANFTRANLDGMTRQGASLLVSADQGWLGHQPDYPGLLASFQVALLAADVIVFDLRHPPASSDSLYFLESGHTLRGSFRIYWQAHGGVAQFGYPLTEELKEVNPDDGQQRTVQYFERAMLELHPDKAGTLFDVQLAPLGRWLLQAHEKAAEAIGTKLVGIDPIPDAPNTPTYQFFRETRHSVKGEFLKFWQTHGGLARFGYPVGEELNEVSPADGKVHIVQYFERARLEWHQEQAGTPQQVQLGLVGREWLELAHP